MINKIYNEIGIEALRTVSLGQFLHEGNWPSWFLPDSSEQRKKRSKSAVFKEYDSEKWPIVLSLMEMSETLVATGTLSEYLMELNNGCVNTTQMSMNTLVSYDDCQIRDAETVNKRERLQVEFMAAIIARFRQKSSHLVELGCGYGKWLFYLLGRFPDIQKASCGDISPTAIQAVKSIASQFDTQI